MGLLTPLLVLHLVHKLHQLLNREQDTAARNQIMDRCMKRLTCCIGKSTKSRGIHLPKQIEQCLTGGSLQKLTQHLQIEGLLPVESNGPQPAQPLKACQLL